MRFTTYSEVTCVESDFPGANPDREHLPAKVWSLSFKPDQDMRSLFPYINATVDDALWYEKPEHVRFLIQGRRCILYPGLVAVHFFETRAAAENFIRPMLDFFNRLDDMKGQIQPNFNRIRHVGVLDVFRLLPRTNCGACGSPTCMAFAAAVARGRATPHACPELSSPISESAVYPLTDEAGNLVQSLALPIDTAGLRHRVRVQAERIRELEARLDTTEGQAAPEKDPEPLLKPASGAAPESSPVAALTAREIEVLALIARGCTNIEIGGLLFISPHTVKSHMINIFNKFGVSDRTRAAVLGVRSGLI